MWPRTALLPPPKHASASKQVLRFYPDTVGRRVSTLQRNVEFMKGEVGMNLHQIRRYVLLQGASGWVGWVSVYVLAWR